MGYDNTYLGLSISNVNFVPAYKAISKLSSKPKCDFLDGNNYWTFLCIFTSQNTLFCHLMIASDVPKVSLFL